MDYRALSIDYRALLIDYRAVLADLGDHRSLFGGVIEL